MKSLAASSLSAGLASTELLADAKFDGEAFAMKFAPHFGMAKPIAGEDPISELNYMYDRGFRAWEDNGMPAREKSLQNRIAKEMSRLEMQMGVFVAHKDFANPLLAGNRWAENHRKRDPEAVRALLKADMEMTVELAKRVNAKWVTVVPGTEDPSLEYHYQFQNVVDNLKFCAEMLEPHGVIMVLEPLNHMNHPGLFLKHMPQAYAVCKAVGSPSCKILDDLYHQQISEGNLIPNIDRCWDEIAYFQAGDNPGRNEPTTGEINYGSVFRHIRHKGYEGIIGMEHGVSIKGPRGVEALINAYRSVDAKD